MVSFVNPGTLQVQYNILNWSISNGVLPAFCGAKLSLKQGRDAKTVKSWEKRMCSAEMVSECVLRADQIPVLQHMPCANTGSLQVRSLCRRPAVFQIRCGAGKVHG